MKKWRLTLIAIVLLAVTLSCSFFTSSTSPTESLSPSGYVDTVTMAKATDPSTYEPVNPTTVFAPTDTIHAVVHVVNAPSDTQFKAVWYTVNVGSSSENNQEIDTSVFTFGDTGYIDFYLSPSTSFPTGTYQVKVYVNATLDRTVDFSIK